MKRTREHALGTRTALLEAAECVFYERGFTGATLDEIARRAGVTRGALYGHFENKLAILNALFADAARPLDPFAVKLTDCEAHSFEQFIEEIRRCWRDVTNTPRAGRLYALLLNLFTNSPDAEPLLKRFKEAVRNSEWSIEEWLRRAICDGSLPETFNSEKAARVIHATLNGLLRRRLLDLDEKPLPDAEVGAIVRALVK
ncbi:TetR/AcrR family transcriptional regulator [Paraburkholderia sp. J67]|uniref:TetR/AcrR family transcriptional regulator n=1 Tax=Paraburkholderia sp. J67 TaxID=2805435 RepID=UPI002ABDB919|nr:TetR family transcriptional regulator [Paraburkholderia sp. J67]